MLGQGLGQCYRIAGDDVDDAVRYVGGFEHLVEVGHRQRRTAGRDQDHGVAHGDRRSEQRHRAEQRPDFRCDDAEHAEWLHHSRRHGTGGRIMHGAVVLVGPAGEGE